MAKSISFSTETNLFGYATRYFQERASTMGSNNIQIKSVLITEAGSIFVYDETNERSGHIVARTAGFDKYGYCRYDMIIGDSD